MLIIKLVMVLAGLFLLATAHALYGLVSPLDDLIDQVMRLLIILHAGAAFYCAGLLHIMRRR
tara:strand:+ start:316 stop:501 length:186 start_codon:yes stop_codon:yes gene_type:complete